MHRKGFDIGLLFVWLENTLRSGKSKSITISELLDRCVLHLNESNWALTLYVVRLLLFCHPECQVHKDLAHFDSSSCNLQAGFHSQWPTQMIMRIWI